MGLFSAVDMRISSTINIFISLQNKLTSPFGSESSKGVSHLGLLFPSLFGLIFDEIRIK